MTHHPDQRNSENSSSSDDVTASFFRGVLWSFGLIVLYILSIGPMYWLASRGVFGTRPIHWLSTIYQPLWWLERTPLKDVLHWYIRVGMD